jgi:hypothetical protein
MRARIPQTIDMAFMTSPSDRWKQRYAAMASCPRSRAGCMMVA